MTWKACNGCTRAIAISALTCEYCGEVCGEGPELRNAEENGRPDSAARGGGGAASAAPDLDTSWLWRHEGESSPAEITRFESETEPAAASQDVVPPPVVPARGRRDIVVAATAVLAAGALVLTYAASRSAAPHAAAAGAVVPAAADRTEAHRSGPRAAAGNRPAPGWRRVADGRWIGGDRRTVAFEAAAANPVAVWTRIVTPLLVVRCHAGTVEAFVYTQSAAQMEPQDANHSVRLSFDGGSEVSERWPDSAEHDALFAPDAPDFVERLTRARVLRVRYTPHNAPPVLAEFGAEGLPALLDAEPRACGRRTPAAQKQTAKGTL